MTTADLEQMFSGFEYMKSFDEQIDDFTNPNMDNEKVFGRDALLVGSAPEVFESVGLPNLPVTINQEHIKYALNGTYPDESKREGHIFAPEEIKKLPDKIAHPIAIAYDPTSAKEVIVYVDMINTTGDQVVVPLRIGGVSNIGNSRINALKIDSVYARENGLQMLESAIRNNREDKATLFYIDKEKAAASRLGDDTKTIVRGLNSGLIHNITDPASSVKIDITDQQKSIQFKRWFNGSKVVNEDGSPRIVYHGTSENFTVFDMSKGRSTMDIQGAFFSPWEEDSAGYGDNVGAFYLSIKNPADEQTAYAALRMFQGQNEAGKKAREYLISKGYDGVINGVPGQPEEYIAFYPTQIKSATDNVGTFDRNNPDYRYSYKGEMTTADMDQALIGAGALSQEDIDAYDQKNSRPLEGKSAKWTQAEGPAQRQFGGENGMLQQSDELDQAVIDYISKNNAYFPDTNASQVKRAVNWIRSLGTKAEQANQNAKEGEVNQDAYSMAVQKVTSKSFDYRSADGQARMIAVMALAAHRNDVAAQVQLADAFNRQGTDLGRSLQSRKLFKLMTPEGRISTLQKMLGDQQAMLDAKGKNVDLKFSDWIYQAAAVATEEGDMQKVQAAAAQELAEQIPASWKDRLNTIRMLSMLANPRTHIRNVIGNAMFIPAVSLKNKMSAVMELGVKQGDKTKTLAPILSKEIRNFARQDANAIKDVLTGEAKYNEANQIKQNQAPLGKFVKVLSDFNSNALEKEDWIFLKGHYRRALGGWMQANGYTAEQLQNDQALLEKGRAYAIDEAQKATYRDFNKAAQVLNEVSRKGGATGFLVDAALPFKKTPANILRRGMEYSPIGIAKALTTDAFHMKQYLDYQNGKLSALPDKALSPTQVIDHLCSGLAGTAVTALGFLLAGCGAVSCGLDDDEDKFEKSKGNQEYAVRFKLFGQDVTFTMDWAAPMSMPFFVGAAIREQMENEGGTDIEEMLNAFGAISEPVFNLSMLDGVNTLFKTSAYDNSEQNQITQILGKIGTNYLSSYVPSVLGALTRTAFDDTKRKSFVEQGKGNGIMGNIRYAIKSAENKIPGLSKTNIPARDIWGNPETSGLVERIIENFISPGYINEYKNDPIINEMGRLYEATGDAGMIPEIDPKKYYEYTKYGEKHKVIFTDKQWDQYKEVRGQTAFNELTELINSDEYQKADNAAQVQMIKNVWTHANRVGLQSVIPDLDVEEVSIPALAKDSRISTNKSEMIKALNAGDYDAYDTMVEALREDEVEDSAIKQKISDTYRNQYKDAYRKGDYIRMAEIEELLDNTGFDFDYYKWQEQVDEKYGK